MARAIKSTCSHCEREMYFDPRLGVSLDALSSLSCSECGHSGAVLMLYVDAPTDATVFDQLPRRDDSTLGQTLGWKTMWKELAPRLRCMRCRQRGASLTISLPVRRCPMCQRPI
jgi:hypothetical protein